MRARILIIVAACALAASVLVKCDGRAPDFNPNLISLKDYRDKLIATLTTQLENVNYPATIIAEGETVNIRVGQASVIDVRRPICQPADDGTLWTLCETGIRKVKIISDTQTLDIELGQDGRCRKSP